MQRRERHRVDELGANHLADHHVLDQVGAAVHEPMCDHVRLEDSPIAHLGHFGERVDIALVAAARRGNSIDRVRQHACRIGVRRLHEKGGRFER